MELLNVYNTKGERLDNMVERGYQDSNLGDDEFVGISQIYIENNEGKYLIEESAKKTGNKYLPVGGHISYGETPYETIIREVKEEIGLDILSDNVISLGFIITDARIRFLFYLKKTVDIDKLVLQKEEVLNISYMSVDEISKLINKGLMHPSHKELLKRILEYKNR